MPDVVILCGGKGTRAHPDTVELPKPLLTVGALPVVEHVMHIYARQGHRRFILAVGHLGELIAERYAEPPPGLEVEVVDTGIETETGERLRRAAAHTTGDRFFATYADGVGDVDVNGLLRTHIESGALATVTTVPLPSQYGVLESDDDGRITCFREKPQLAEHWINGGFFVFERAALDEWEGEVLEREVLPALSRIGRLYVYRHRGFWKSMDTYKDRQELDALAEGGAPPWEVAAALPEPAPAAMAIADASWVRAESSASGNGPAEGIAAGHRPASVPGSKFSRLGEGGSESPALEQVGRPRVAAAVGAPTSARRRPSGEDPRPTEGGAGADVSGASFVAPPRRVAERRMAVVAAATVLLDLLAVVATYAFVGSMKSGPLASRLVGSDRAELLVTAPVWLLAFAAHGLYERRRLVAAREEVRRLLQAMAVGAVGVVLLTFALNEDVGRSWVAVVAVTSLVAVAVGRMFVRATIQWLTARGVLGTRVLVVGTNGEAHALARTLDRQRWLGYCPIGFVATGHLHATHDGLPVVATLDRLTEAVQRHEVGAVVFATSDIPPDVLPELCNSLHALDVDVRISPGLPQVAAWRVRVEPLDGLAVLSVSRSNQLSRPQRVVKRSVDVVVGTVLLLVTAPLVVGLAILVRITSRGPALFRQVRVGEAGRPFVLRKLRTMGVDTEERVIDLSDDNEADGLLFKIGDDPRVTRVGRLLRRWALDELPQLWNVVKGDMSLVGPRPPLPSETDRYDEWVRGRLKVKPGITGLWQVNGGHELRFDDYVRYDLFYVENWSLGLDLYVLARTVPAMFFRRGLT